MNHRGTFIVQAVVLIIILVMFATWALRLMLGRATVVNRTMDTTRKQYISQGAQNWINSCLNGNTLPNCQTSDQPACFPSPWMIDGHQVTVTLVRDANNICHLQIFVAN